MKIVTARRFGLWWKLAQRWFKKQRREAVAAVNQHTDDSLDAKVVPFLYAECSNEDINEMFEPASKEGYIILQDSALAQDGYIREEPFEALTGLQFV